MRRTVLFGVLAVSLSGCLAGPPDQEGLRAGVYHAQFDIVAGTNVPPEVVGHHDFVFRVVAPIFGPEAFTILSSRLNSRSDYLEQVNNRTVATEELWTVAWGIDVVDARVQVLLKEESSGEFSVPSCKVIVPNVTEIAGSGCTVVRE